jgi:hypothetical protein
VQALILIPEVERLTWDSTCNSRSPIVKRGEGCAYNGHRAWKEDFETGCYMCGDGQDGLPLVWEGEVVPEAMDRAIRFLNLTIERTVLLFANVYTVEDARDVARAYFEHKLGTFEEIA